jgi:peptidoglycan hydrolase-like protein with peptidoglycan-binding domain
VRQLQIEQPPMRGTDVSDWQTFLIKQGTLADPADGVFGPDTAAASRAYQTKIGVGADGVIGPFTLARAIEGGFTSSSGPLTAGMDTDANCTTFAAAIAAAGIKFVVRYYSRSTLKVLTAGEAAALCKAGLQLMTVYEDDDELASLTAVSGPVHAQTALAQAAAVKQPKGSAIYFAVDLDPTADDVNGQVMEYFHAVHTVMAGSAYKTGIYGSGLTCRLIRDAGFAKFTWLSQSTGFQEYQAFLPQADVVQAAPSRDLVPQRLNIDDDIAQSSAFGAFQVG